MPGIIYSTTPPCAMSKLTEMGLINFYVDFEDYPIRYKNCLYLLMNPGTESLGRWNSFYQDYKRHKNYVNTLYVDMNVIVLVFKIEEIYKAFPKYLIDGKYSLMGEAYAKLRFSKVKEDFIGRRTIIKDKQFLIITKDPALKNKMENDLDITLDDNAELFDKPIQSKEVLNWKLMVEDYKKRNYDQHI